MHGWRLLPEWDREAERRKGLSFSSDLCCRSPLQMAAMLFRKGYEIRNIESTVRLANTTRNMCPFSTYFFGEGVLGQRTESIELLRIGVAAGDAVAMFLLGFILCLEKPVKVALFSGLKYYSGNGGTPKNVSEALQLFLGASDRGTFVEMGQSHPLKLCHVLQITLYHPTKLPPSSRKLPEAGGFQ